MYFADVRAVCHVILCEKVNKLFLYQCQENTDLFVFPATVKHKFLLHGLSLLLTASAVHQTCTLTRPRIHLSISDVSPKRFAKPKLGFDSHF